MGSQVWTPVGRKLSSLVGTPVGSQSSINDGYSSTSIPHPFIPENQKCWTCSKEFGSKTIVWTHADPLAPPGLPPQCLAHHDFFCVPYSNCSETIDNQTPLDIETGPLGVHRGSNLSFFRALPSDDVMQEIVREVPSWDYIVGDWIDSQDPSALVHPYCQVDELFISHSPVIVNSRTLMKFKAHKTTHGDFSCTQYCRQHVFLEKAHQLLP